MLPFHPLSTAVQADRERDIRDRSPLQLGVRSGRRRAAAEPVEAPAPMPAAQAEASDGGARPPTGARLAFGPG